jgi:hypothetical protein
MRSFSENLFFKREVFKIMKELMEKFVLGNSHRIKKINGGDRYG